MPISNRNNVEKGYSFEFKMVLEIKTQPFLKTLKGFYRTPYIYSKTMIKNKISLIITWYVFTALIMG